MSKSNLTKRVEKLEHSGLFASPQLLLSRLATALNGAALRITGKFFSAAPCDQPTQELIFTDLQEHFFRSLSAVDLDSLEAELGRIAYGDNTAALEAAKRKVLGLPATEALEVESEPLAEC